MVTRDDSRTLFAWRQLQDLGMAACSARLERGHCVPSGERLPRHRARVPPARPADATRHRPRQEGRCEGCLETSYAQKNVPASIWEATTAQSTVTVLSITSPIPEPSTFMILAVKSMMLATSRRGR